MKGGAPPVTGDVNGVGQDRIGPVRVTLQQVGDAFGVHHGRPVRARRAQPSQGDLGIAPHLGDTATAQARPAGRREGRARGVAVGEVSRGCGPFDRRRQTLGCPGPAEEGEDQRTVDGDAPNSPRPRSCPRATLSSGGRCRHAHWTTPAASVQDEPGDPLSVARGLGVLDGGLWHGIRLVPRAARKWSASARSGSRCRSSASNSSRKQLVVAVPLTATVEGDHQEIAALQLFENPGRSLPGEGGVAERPTHRSRIEVRVRNDTSAPDTRSRNSERR